jgi:glyoxylase-like metal-dependent hydrolase (beta-lactamase superfamily II)
MKKGVWMLKLMAGLWLMVLWSPTNAADFDFKYPRSGVDMHLQKVSEHVWFVQGATGVATDNEGFISNAAVIIDDHDITIVDALGSPSLAEQLLSLIREISALPIKRVISTHYHADHIYGLQVFVEQGAEVLAPYGVHEYLNSPAAAERLEERRFSLEPWVNEQTRLVLPDKLIKKSTQLKGQAVSMTINYLGKSHSDADLTIFVEPDNVFITGDVIFEGRIPFVGDSDSKAWLETLNAMADQKGISALIPGHGGLAKDPAKAIGLTRDYLAYLREHLGAGVQEMMTFDELYDAIDWSPFENLPAFELGNRVNAYQVFLALEKEMLAQ